MDIHHDILVIIGFCIFNLFYDMNFQQMQLRSTLVTTYCFFRNLAVSPDLYGQASGMQLWEFKVTGRKAQFRILVFGSNNSPENIDQGMMEDPCAGFFTHGFFTKRNRGFFDP